MRRTLLGKKIGMTRVFEEAGKEIAVTVIEAGPCTVVQCKTDETDGYAAIQVGYGERKRSRTNSPLTGHFESRGMAPKQHLREIRLDAGDAFETGDVLKVEMFKVGEIVDVTGTSKGKGFAGGMKRHGFKGGPQTHGSKVHRAPQSSGATDAARVFKGTRKPGQMGNVQVTTRGLTVVDVDSESNLLVLKGSVPGAPGGLVVIRGRG